MKGNRARFAIRRGFFAGLLASLAALGCRPEGWQPVAPASDGSLEPADTAVSASYSTTPGDRGVRGGEGTERIEGAMRRHFSRATLVPDGRLARLADRVLQRVAEQRGQMPELGELDALAREQGFVGPCPVVFVVPFAEDQWERFESNLASLPANMRFTHFGIVVREISGTPLGGLVMGSQHFTLAPVPRRVAEGGNVHFSGAVAAEYRDIEWAWTLPDGSTRPIALDGGNAFSFRTDALAAGVHRFEILGTGPTGLEVVANVPIVSGDAASARVPRDDVDETDPVAAMFELTNRARARAQLPPLQRAAVLERIAAAHSDDMTRTRFVGHESPVTRGPADRVRAANLRLAVFGENVAYAATAAASHHVLMESPAHRRNILHPAFTHVGIGVTRDASTRPEMLRVTEFFASYPEPMKDTAAFASALFAQMNRSRAAASLPPVSRSPALDGVAARLSARFAGARGLRPEEAGTLLSPEDVRVLQAGPQVRVMFVFPSTPSEIAVDTTFVSAGVRAVGIGVVQAPPREDEPRVNVVAVVLDG